ncbi:MAG: lasso peptide biosynthesis B2 protein [Chloroflexi bacterium]|nr:lasso peptide biosynthesis B2 protein [Chloroflexota bacterium]MDA1147106.1 lasso peptide biosynthesis B2 protein [Chloroflexota bacterium]
MPGSLTSYQRRAFRRFGDFDGEQRRIAVASVFALPAVHLTARFGGLRAVRRVLGDPLSGRHDQTSMDGVATGRRLAAPVATVAAALRLDRRGCLARATFLWWLLRRRGVDAVVVIGSRRDGATFEAHAWVEVDQVAVDDGPDVRERFAALEGSASVMGGTRGAQGAPGARGADR